MPWCHHTDPARFTSNLVASFKSHSISETWFSQLQMGLLWGGSDLMNLCWKSEMMWKMLTTSNSMNITVCYITVWLTVARGWFLLGTSKLLKLCWKQISQVASGFVAANSRLSAVSKKSRNSFLMNPRVIFELSQTYVQGPFMGPPPASNQW